MPCICGCASAECAEKEPGSGSMGSEHPLSNGATAFYTLLTGKSASLITGLRILKNEPGSSKNGSTPFHDLLPQPENKT